MKVNTQRFKLQRLVLITGLVFGMAACGDDSLAPPPSPPPVNIAPTIASVAVTVANEGQEYTYTFTATDLDADALTFAATTLPAWLTFEVTPGSLILTGTPVAADVGSAEVVLTVSDGTDTVTQSFTITVEAAVVQEAPTFTSTPVTTGRVGDAYSYTATATDANFDTLEFSEVTVPPWALFDAASATLSGTPDVAGSYNVEILVDDGIDSVSQSFTIVVAPPPELGPELILNGTFDDGLTGWNMIGSVIVEDGNNVLSVPIAAAAANPFDVNQSYIIDIVEGETYVFTFRARASVTRTMIAGLGLNGGNFNSITKTVTLTDEWTTYTAEVVANGIGGVGSRVLFDMGASAGDIFIDDVSVRLVVESTGGGDTGGGDTGGGAELVANGTFDDGLTGWKMIGSVILEDGNSVLSVPISVAAANAFDINQSHVVSIVEGTSYTFSFRARASVERTMIAGVGLNGGNFNSVNETVTLTTAWQTFTIDVVANGIGGVDEESRVFFDMGAEVGDIFIDDVSLQAADAGTGGGGNAGPPAGVADIGATGFVTNGGFETGNLTGWGSVGADITVEEDDLGSFLVKIVAAESGTPFIRQERMGEGDVTGGQALTVSFNMRGTAVNGGIVNVLLYTDDPNSTPAVTKTEVLFANVPSEEWTPYTYNVTAGSPAGWGLTILLQPTCGAVTGCAVTAYFDNVSITAQ